MQEIEQSAGFGFDDRFHHQLAGAIANRNRNRFLVHVQTDILNIATQHAGYLLGGKVILQPEHFPPRLSVILLLEAAAMMQLSARRSRIGLGLSGGQGHAGKQPERRLSGLDRSRGDAAASPVRYPLAETSYRERHQSDKSWGRGGKAPAGCAGHQSFLLKHGRPSHNAYVLRGQGHIEPAAAFNNGEDGGDFGPSFLASQMQPVAPAYGDSPDILPMSVRN